MLMTSILMLLSVVIPHHHHSNEIPCYKSLATEATDNGHSQDDTHSCCCNGHNMFFFNLLQSHTTDADVDLYLFPLLVLFDYINPPTLAFCKQLVECNRVFYIESLHDTWIVCASGLRAPPML